MFNPITGVIGPRRTAKIMHALMTRLFGSAGSSSRTAIGDMGAAWMAHNRPDALLGNHMNMVNLHAEDVAPTTTEEKELVAKRDEIMKRESGYNDLQETRPQTLGVALAGSTIGVAAWILERFGKWSDLPTKADGPWHRPCSSLSFGLVQNTGQITADASSKHSS